MSYESLLWLVIGLLPYRIKRQYRAERVITLEIRALFWSLRVYARPGGRTDWSLRVSFIERLRDVVWTVLTRLHPTNDDSQA